MSDYYCAVDLGASSGRVIVGRKEDGAIRLTEIHRFPNGAVKRGARLVWDADALFAEILIGLKKCAEAGKTPVSVGIDAWGVDYALLGKLGARIGDCIAYRDSRTEGVPAAFDKILPAAELYRRTGIAKQPYNTIYQLIAAKLASPDDFGRAAQVVPLASYLAYLLTGNVTLEYTSCTTTGLVNALTRDWDDKVIAAAALPRGLFGKIEQPGALVGNLTNGVKAKIGYDCEVRAVCAHDTASAVLAADLDEGSLFLSSGTWSLLGAVLDAPILTEESRLSGISNEGGYGGTYRYLKNIMGSWVIQGVRKDLGGPDYAETERLARSGAGYGGIVDVNADRFLSPESMAAEIKAALLETGQEPPKDAGELIYCVYASLARSYADTVQHIERLTGKAFGKITIVGGGARDELLNELTADATGKTTIIGPAEATAIGSIAAQIRKGE